MKVGMIVRNDKKYSLLCLHLFLVRNESQRAESVMDVLQNNSTIALFSPANFSFELFYLCKVCYFGYATEDLVDEYNHVVNVGAPYIKVKYYEKKAEKKVLFCTNY